MINFICFGSGSSGNCYYLKSGGYGLLIDMGLSVRRFRKYFYDYGLSIAEVKGVLVTHDHADHAKYVGALSKEFHIPVYALEKVFVGIERNRYVAKKVPKNLANVIQEEETFELGPFRITSFGVPHDSAANCGYDIEAEGVRYCLMTDIGHVTEQMRQHLREAQYVVVEANYDDAMLESGRYPRFLKERIRSGRGHLENTEAGRFLAKDLSVLARRVWLCHLSEENNRPDLAVEVVSAALRDTGRLGGESALVVEALQRTHPSRLYELK